MKRPRAGPLHGSVCSYAKTCAGCIVLARRGEKTPCYALAADSKPLTHCFFWGFAGVFSILFREFAALRRVGARHRPFRACWRTPNDNYSSRWTNTSAPGLKRVGFTLRPYPLRSINRAALPLEESPFGQTRVRAAGKNKVVVHRNPHDFPSLDELFCNANILPRRLRILWSRAGSAIERFLAPVSPSPLPKPDVPVSEHPAFHLILRSIRHAMRPMMASPTDGFVVFHRPGLSAFEAVDL